MLEALSVASDAAEEASELAASFFALATDEMLAALEPRLLLGALSSTIEDNEDAMLSAEPVSEPRMASETVEAASVTVSDK
jgi:hypothetical protein